MAALRIGGGHVLHGDVAVSGAKNAVLKLMAAALLTEEPSVVRNVPDIIDVHIMMAVLRSLGAGVDLSRGELKINPTIVHHDAPYELVNRMRASILVLGPLISRYGFARVAMPGGCNIGRRRIDIHLAGLMELGAEIELREGYIEGRASRLRGAHITFHFPSVGATENILMASVLAEGTTVIENAAREPEVVDLANFLIAMGAGIEGVGTSRVVVNGVDRLRGVRHTVIADRIEATTYMMAVAATGGTAFIRDAQAEHLHIVLEKLDEAGVGLDVKRSGIGVRGDRGLRALDVATLPYPGFPTDLQSPITALMAIAEGTSIITENIFENRFLHVDELTRMGALIEVEGKHAIVRGVERLYGVPVRAPDLRGGAALIIAALAADGETILGDAEHVFRGYERLCEKFRALGADIEEIEEEHDDLCVPRGY